MNKKPAATTIPDEPHHPGEAEKVEPSAIRIPLEWLWHYGVLHALRDGVLRERDLAREEGSTPIEPHSMDMADSATDEFDHDLALSLLTHDQRALEEIDAAIQRILDGTYGICEETGLMIPASRLRVVPWTRYTRDVQQRRERELKEREGPVLPPLRSIQGTDANMMAEAEDDEAEELIVREVQRHQSEEQARENIESAGEELEQREEQVKELSASLKEAMRNRKNTPARRPQRKHTQTAPVKRARKPAHHRSMTSKTRPPKS